MDLASVWASCSYLPDNEVHFRAKIVEDAGLLTPDVACPYNHKPATAPRSQPHVKIASGPCINMIVAELQQCASIDTL